MKKTLIIFSLFLVFANAEAQSYNVLFIPDSLKEHANAVKRDETITLEIKSINKAILKHKYAITILNEAGEIYSFYHNDYDKLQSLSDIDGNLYDAFGKKLKNVKRKDIADIPDQSDYSLATDTRYKLHSFRYTNYPYTVEYEDEVEFNGIFYLPDWSAQDGENQSVQSASFIVTTPKDYKLRYKEINYPGMAVINNSSENITYTWAVKNVKAKYKEQLCPDWREIISRVLIAPTNFEIEGYAGNMDSWDGFGKFIYKLIAGRDELDDATKSIIHRLTDNLLTNEQKVDTLYKYMQANTRYVNIDFGLGGWQPFDAKYVAQKKYGDCKALSNFMGALLKEAGINSSYGVIYSGKYKNYFNADFPSNQFNHVIRCVPLNQDTIWLECTNQDMPTGYIGNFTSNRPALLVTDNGGRLVNTVTYTDKDNFTRRNITASLDEKGNLTAIANSVYSGEEFQDPYFISLKSSKQEIIESIIDNIGNNNFTINNYSYKIAKGAIPSIEETLEMSSTLYANVSGKRIFIIPDLLTQSGAKFDTSEKRNTDIVYPLSFTHTDTVRIRIPQGYSVESMPKEIILDTKFGYYENHFSYSGNTLQYIRISRRRASRFDVSEYKNFAQFYNSIYKADHSQCVLVKASN